MKNLIFKVVLVIVLIIAVNLTVMAGSKEYGYTIISGKIKGNWDTGNPPDVYVEILSKEASHYKKTNVVVDSYEPIWNFSATLSHDMLWLSVYDEDTGKDQTISHIGYVSLSSMSVGETKSVYDSLKAIIFIRRDK